MDIEVDKLSDVIQLKNATIYEKRTITNFDYSLGGDLLSEVDSYIHISVLRCPQTYNGIIMSIASQERHIKPYVLSDATINQSSVANELPYLTLFRPLINHASTAWDPHTSRNIDCIEMIQ